MWLRSHRLEVQFGSAAAILIGALIWLERSGTLARWATALEPMLQALAGLGIVGAFLLGLVGNSSVMLQVPYTIPMLSAAIAGAPLPYLLALGVAAGLGATAGEMVSYAIADQILRREDLTASGLFRWVDGTVRAHPRAIPWLVFGFAVTLLPDDAVLIPLAMIRYGAGRVVVPLLLGKLGYCLGSAVVFHLAGEQAGSWLTPHATADVAVLGLVAFFVVIAYQVAKGRRSPTARSEQAAHTADPR
ncbi:MAG: hypothetical protein WCF04_14645 [Candidatus Nanopelagicales bacterium]